MPKIIYECIHCTKQFDTESVCRQCEMLHSLKSAECCATCKSLTFTLGEAGWRCGEYDQLIIYNFNVCDKYKRNPGHMLPVGYPYHE